MSSFEEVPHLKGEIGNSDEDAVKCLQNAVAEMQARYEKFQATKVKTLVDYNKKTDSQQRMPWIAIVLDEYADLVSEPDVRKEIEALMKRLAAKARGCGIHVIIATQKPSAESISTTIRSNLPAQLALKCHGPQESRIIINESGAESLNGKGDAFLKLADRIERIQCALCADEA